MKYAVIKTGGKQYKVSENESIEVERLSIDSKNFDFDKVLLVNDDKTLRIGKPFVKGAVVCGEILENLKGKKIRVSKFKSKVRYRKTTGHRQLLTRVQIKEISAGK